MLAKEKIAKYYAVRKKHDEIVVVQSESRPTSGEIIGESETVIFEFPAYLSAFRSAAYYKNGWQKEWTGGSYNW